MGTIYQRFEGAPYQGQWTDAKGISHRRSLKTRDRKVALERLRQYELVSTDPATHAHYTLGSAIGGYLKSVAVENAAKTLESYTQKGHNLMRVIGDVELSTLTRDTALAYAATRLREGVSHSTIHKEFVVLRGALADAAERKVWIGSPQAIVPKIKVSYTPRKRWLTPVQAAHLIDEVSLGRKGSEPRSGKSTFKRPQMLWRKLWVALAALSGLRLSEIEKLCWSHVSLTTRSIEVPGTKTPGSMRTVPMAASLAEMLRAAKGKSLPSDRIVRPWTNVRRDLPLAMARINRRRASEAVRKRRPVPEPWPTRVSPNDLRRTFASWLKQQGTDSLVVAKLLGHSSTRMVELVYGHLSDRNLTDAIASLPKMAA